MFVIAIGGDLTQTHTERGMGCGDSRPSPPSPRADIPPLESFEALIELEKDDAKDRDENHVDLALQNPSSFDLVQDTQSVVFSRLLSLSLSLSPSSFLERPPT